MGKKQVKAVMGQLKLIEGEPFVIFATGRYLGESFDLPDLGGLFLMFPIS